MKVHPYLRPGRDFAYPEYGAVYPPDRGFSVKHLRLELWIDFGSRRIRGIEELRLSRSDGGEGWVKLDACELEVLKVTSDGAPTDWHYDGQLLSVKVRGTEPVVAVEYRASPRKGLHFVGPDRANPGRGLQCWSQGETEYNRYWMVLLDHPSVKHTSELIVHVPKGFVAVSNGDLVRHEVVGDEEVWHWLMDRPHSPYLISVAAGEFELIEERHNGILLQYYIPRGWRDKAHLSFSKTPKVIDFLSSYLNHPYPYRKYAQVVVHEFIFGGMENTTATTLTDLTLHDELAHEEFSSDPLVAHELVHQWFGDLVTCRDWPHIWLNESFATYLENLFVLHDKGEEEFVYEMVRDLDSYLSEYRERYARPIVTRVYKYAAELFDSHAYPKGALVLNALRSLLGDEVFRRGLSEFLRRFAYRTADTEDFRKVMEEVSGRNLELFFEQYLYNAGHPVISVEEEYDEGTGHAEAEVQADAGRGLAPGVLGSCEGGGEHGIWQEGVQARAQVEGGGLRPSGGREAEVGLRGPDVRGLRCDREEARRRGLDQNTEGGHPHLLQDIGGEGAREEREREGGGGAGGGPEESGDFLGDSGRGGEGARQREDRVGQARAPRGAEGGEEQEGQDGRLRGPLQLQGRQGGDQL